MAKKQQGFTSCRSRRQEMRSAERPESHRELLVFGQHAKAGARNKSSDSQRHPLRNPARGGNVYRIPATWRLLLTSRPISPGEIGRELSLFFRCARASIDIATPSGVPEFIAPCHASEHEDEGRARTSRNKLGKRAALHYYLKQKPFVPMS